MNFTDKPIDQQFDILATDVEKAFGKTGANPCHGKFQVFTEEKLAECCPISAIYYAEHMDLIYSNKIRALEVTEFFAEKYGVSDMYISGLWLGYDKYMTDMHHMGNHHFETAEDKEEAEKGFAVGQLLGAKYKKMYFNKIM